MTPHSEIWSRCSWGRTGSRCRYENKTLKQSKVCEDQRGTVPDTRFSGGQLEVHPKIRIQSWSVPSVVHETLLELHSFTAETSSSETWPYTGGRLWEQLITTNIYGSCSAATCSGCSDFDCKKGGSQAKQCKEPQVLLGRRLGMDGRIRKAQDFSPTVI